MGAAGRGEGLLARAQLGAGAAALTAAALVVVDRSCVLRAGLRAVEAVALPRPPGVPRVSLAGGAAPWELSTFGGSERAGAQFAALLEAQRALARPLPAFGTAPGAADGGRAARVLRALGAEGPHAAVLLPPPPLLVLSGRAASLTPY